MSKSNKKIDFESSLKELELIVAKLEDAELKVKELLDDGSAQELDNT